MNRKSSTAPRRQIQEWTRAFRREDKPDHSMHMSKISGEPLPNVVLRSNQSPMNKPDKMP